MNKVEYLLYAYKKQIYLDNKWYLEMFSIHTENKEYEYIVIKDNIKYFKVDEHLLETTVARDKPMLEITDTIKLKKFDIPCLKEDIYTSIGIFIANLLTVVYPFNNKVDYINNIFTPKVLEAKLPNLLKNGIITVEERDLFINAVSFSLNFNKQFSYSFTKVSATPAPGMGKYKKELRAKYDKEYGPEWIEDEIKALQFVNELKKYDNKYISKDPSYGKILSGKIVNNSRPRMYMSFGVESGFDNTGKDSTFVIESLSEGYPKDKRKLRAIMNSARKGSYDRGAETQQGGFLVKEMQRASNTLTIKDGDCETKKGLPITVTEKNYKNYKNVYLIEKGISIFKEDLKEYIGQTVEIRSTQYCKYVDSFCTICGGKDLEEYKNGISLLIIASGGVVLNISMSKLHKAAKQLVNFDITKYIR